MRSLRESLFDIDDNIDKVDRSLVEKFLKDNYKGLFIISNKPNKDGLYEVFSKKGIIVENKSITSLTNGMFIWTFVWGKFDCSCCFLLESLKGAPREVVGYFDCSECKSLKTLEGAPEEVEGGFYCNDCTSLESLEGVPKTVKEFDCSCCYMLHSLKGAPKEVYDRFSCRMCGGKFSSKDVDAVCKVNEIWC